MNIGNTDPKEREKEEMTKENGSNNKEDRRETGEGGWGDFEVRKHGLRGARESELLVK